MRAPSDLEIRTALLQQATEFSRRTGIPLSTIGMEAVRSPGFLSRIRDGKNFNMESYRRVVDWLDRQERQMARREVKQRTGQKTEVG